MICAPFKVGFEFFEVWVCTNPRSICLKILGNLFLKDEFVLSILVLNHLIRSYIERDVNFTKLLVFWKNFGKNPVFDSRVLVFLTSFKF